MNYKQCQFCGKSFQKAGLGPHESHCKKRNADPKMEQPTVITKEYLQTLYEEANRLEARAKELRTFVTQLEGYPYDQLDGFVLMIAKKS